MHTKGYAATSATTPLAPFAFERRTPGDRDVHVTIDFCGICHSDIHSAKNEWQGTEYPFVPGHEIIGRVVKVGRDVKRFKEEVTDWRSRWLWNRLTTVRCGTSTPLGRPVDPDV